MSSPIAEYQPAIRCFLSYAHDDEATLNFVDEFKATLSNFAYSDRGRRLEIFLDHDSIGWGEDWREEIAQSVESALVFIPLVTVQYLQRPMCRQELLLFVESAEKLGVTDLFLPVVVLGHRQISESSPDAIAQLIAKRQYKDLRDAVLDGVRSATWRRTLLDLANALVDAVESAELRLQSTQPGQDVRGSKQGGSEVGELDEDDPSLETIQDEITERVSEIQQTVEEIGEVLGDVAEITTRHSSRLNGADNKQGRVIILAFANEVKEPSSRSEELGKGLEVKTAEVDLALRKAWRMVADYGTQEMKSSFRQLIDDSTSDIQQLSETQSGMADMLAQLKALEVLSVPLRRALRPLRNGLTSTRAAMGIVGSWNDLNSE